MGILRFDTTTRILHWSHAIVFIFLLVTGIKLLFTQQSLLGDPLIKMVHLYASPLLILLPLLIYMFGSISVRNNVKKLMQWTNADLRWLIDYMKMKKTHAIGKFDGGQKADFMGTVLTIIGLSFSGFVVWMKPMFSVAFVELNFVIHDFFAILSILLFSMHLIFVLYHSESLHGIIYGTVNEKWTQKHYPYWFKQKGKI